MRSAEGAELHSAPATSHPTDEQAIARLHLGDTVLAYDPTTGKAESELVQHVWINHDSDLVDVGLQRSASSEPAATSESTVAASAPSRGKHLVAASLALAAALAISGHASGPAVSTAHIATGQTSATSPTETIHTTANHPWLTADRGCVQAGELQPGEQVVTLSGVESTVAWVQVVPGQADYYNLTVAKDHTYAVGDTQAVVHNIGCPPLGQLSDFAQAELQNNWADQEQAFREWVQGGRIGKVRAVGTILYEGTFEDVVPGFMNVPGGAHVEQVMKDAAVETVRTLAAQGYEGDLLITAMSGLDVCPTCQLRTPAWIQEVQDAAGASGLNVRMQFVSWYGLKGSPQFYY